MASLQLDRGFQNANFESWKIGSDFIDFKTALDLPASVYGGASEAVDYLHTRASALRNHLIESHGRVFVVTNAANNAVAIYEVLISSADNPEAAGPELARLAVIPSRSTDSTPGATVEASLHCSLAVVAPLQLTSEAAADGTTDLSNRLLLVSSGRGDLVLVQQQPDGIDGRLSNVVFPLRPPPPGVGVRPFSVEAAWASGTGHIRCVLTAISNTAASSSSSSSKPSSHPHTKWVCDTWLVTLSVRHHQQQPQQGLLLQVVGCQLLLVSGSPPAAAIGTAAAAAAVGSSSSNISESLLIISEPALEDDELPSGFHLSDDPGHGHGQPAAAAAAHLAAGSSAAAAAEEELDDMDIDPWTLQQAAARLAQFTSDSRVGNLPQQPWTDIFQESGPGDLGSGESDSAVDIMLFRDDTSPKTTVGHQAATPPAEAAPGTLTSSSSSPTQAQKMTLSSTVSCGPHMLLAVQELLQGVSDNQSNNNNSNDQSDNSSNNLGLLLGLTDDVDCAVIAVTLQHQQQQQGVVDHAGDSAAAAAAGGSGSDGGITVSMKHQASIPALAYVVAGKTQRRHLLLGGPGSPVSGVLVEGQKYVYLYGQVAQGSTHGSQQILDLELPRGSSVMGARLMYVKQDSSNQAIVKLMLLTQAQLICYTLKAQHARCSG